MWLITWVWPVLHDPPANALKIKTQRDAEKWTHVNQLSGNLLRKFIPTLYVSAGIDEGICALR